MIQIKGTLQREELLAAQWLHIRPRRSLALIGMFLLVVLCALTLWFSFFGPSQSSLYENRWIFLGVVVYLFLFLPLWITYKSKRNYRQRKDLQRELSFIMSDSGLSGRNENGHMNKPWTDYLKWKEGRKCFLLYLSDNFFQIIPKRFFQSQRQIDTFREILEAKVGPK